jgi:hypothetical protein
MKSKSIIIAPFLLLASFASAQTAVDELLKASKTPDCHKATAFADEKLPIIHKIWTMAKDDSASSDPATVEIGNIALRAAKTLTADVSAVLDTCSIADSAKAAQNYVVTTQKFAADAQDFQTAMDHKK